MKTVKIDVRNIFNFERGIDISKKHESTIPGSVPLYGSRKDDLPRCYIEDLAFNEKGKKLKYFNNCIRLNADGDSAGYLFYTKGRFTITNVVSAMTIKDEYIGKIDYEFCALVLTQKISSLFNWGHKASEDRVSKIEIEIPVNTNGDFDLVAQQEIAERYKEVEKIKEKIRSLKENLLSKKTLIKQKHKLIKFQFSDIFECQSGYGFPSSVYKKETSKYPLIRIQDINDLKDSKKVFIPNDYDFEGSPIDRDGILKFEKYLVKDGDFLISLSGAGGFRIKQWHGNDGLLNQRILRIRIKDTFFRHIDQHFIHILFNQIETILNKSGTGANNNLKETFLKSQMISIPVDMNGDFDLIAQQEIAKEYLELNELKKSVAEKLNSLLEKKVLFFA